ncbi:MAG: hypothetical protein KJO69_03655, partial [Gammaproteobacteria bacterium]|nr:hypothetical protein [Gammaproteobacteria bacterium]
HSFNSPEFMVEIDGMSPDNVTLDMGEVMHELASNYQSNTELGREMAYPFGHSFDWLMSAESGKVEGKLATIRMEGFAQAFAVFHSNPELLEQQAPLTYNYMKNILQTAPVEGQLNAENNTDTQEDVATAEGVRGDVQPPSQPRDPEVQDGTGDRGDGGSSVDARQASEGVGDQTQQEDGDNTGQPVQLERTPVVLKATDKKPTFKKAENYEATGEYIVTFADGDRYTLYFDDDAKDAGDEVYFTSEDGKITGLLGETKEETINELQEHRQRLIDAGENSYNIPLNPEVSSDTLQKGYNLVTDHPEGQLKLTDLRKKFRKLEDNQFDNLVERLTDSERDSEDLMVVQDGVISHPETVQQIEEERLAEERMIAEEAEFEDDLQGLMDDDLLNAPSSIERLQEVDSSYNQAKVRSLSQLQERIPLDDRISGEYVEGQPLTPVSGGKFSDLDLSNRGDGLDISQADLESILTEAVRLTDTNAEGQVGDLAKKTVERLGINANTVEFWDRALKLSDNARYWYEVSAEAMRDVMPDLSDTEIKQFISVVAATSPVANPFVNMHRAMASFANNLQGRPIDNDLVIQKGVTDALKTADLEGLKTGSFGGTMQLVLGMAKPTLSTNDRQVAATFNTDGEAIGKNPELYEVMSRFYMGLRDKLNANLPEGAQPYETWQLQALGWVEQRYKNEFVKDKKAEGMSEDAALSLYQSASPEEISGGVNDVDDYSMSLLREDTSGRRDRKGAIQVLKEAGIAVPNNKITREILLDPRVPAALSPTTANFREKRTITAEINSLRNDTGKDARSIFDAAVEQGNQKIADEYHAVFATLLNKSSKGKTNPFTAYFRAMGLTDDAKPTRVATPTGGVPLAVGGTYEGDVSPNIRVPVPASITGDQLNVLMTSLSKQWDQDAVPASHVTDMADGIREGYTETSQVFVETLDALSKDQIEAFANALPEGVEVNFTRYPNGYEFNVLAFDQETFDPVTPDMNEIAEAAEAMQ